MKETTQTGPYMCNRWGMLRDSGWHDKYRFRVEDVRASGEDW